MTICKWSMLSTYAIDIIMANKQKWPYSIKVKPFLKSDNSQNFNVLVTLLDRKDTNHNQG